MTTIAVTPGDPAGIGPDLTLELAHQSPLRLVAIADKTMLAQRAASLGLRLSIVDFQPGPSSTASPDSPKLEVLDVVTQNPVICGKLDPGNASYVLETLRTAVRGCLRKEFDALVTGPIHKGIINDAGIPFSGHTEYLAQLCRVPTPVMMLTIPGLRVALATTHLPLKDVSSTLTQPSLERTIRVLVSELEKRFAVSAPRLVVCGLNPHAGEGGHLGTEEQDVIIPVLEHLRRQGLHLEGPIPADTAFTPTHLETADAVLAMYHDQGLPVLKHAGFGDAVNVTLGLPIVRTSVDHGTAVDLAGTGKASVNSLAAALELAVKLSHP